MYTLLTYNDGDGTTVSIKARMENGTMHVFPVIDSSKKEDIEDYYEVPAKIADIIYEVTGAHKWCMFNNDIVGQMRSGIAIKMDELINNEFEFRKYKRK